MIIPKEIKVAYKNYSIEKVNNLNDGVNLLYGQCKYDEEKILLAEAYSKNQQECTLIHELIHAIDDIFSIGVTEEQVLKLGKGFYQVIKDNPEMFVVK